MTHAHRRRVLPRLVLGALLAAVFLLGGTRPLAQTGPALQAYYLLAAAGTNATVVTGCRATNLYTAELFSIVAQNLFVRFYNLCRTPTEADTPILVVAVSAGLATTGLSLGHTLLNPPLPIRFSTGLAFRTTTNVAVDDTTAVPASALIVNLTYTSN